MTRIVATFLAFGFLNFAEANSVLSGSCGDLPKKQRLECEIRFENQLLKKYKNLFERDDTGLWLKSVRNDEYSRHQPRFLEESIDNQIYRRFRIIAHYPDLLITHIRMYGDENYESFVYDHSYGAYEEVFWNVEVSPNGETLVGFNEDVLVGFSQNAIALYSIEKYWGLKLQASYFPRDFGVVAARFIDEYKIELTITCFIDNESGFSIQDGRAVLHYVDSLWQFQSISCGK